MRRNNRTNTLIKWLVVIGDFVVLNLVLTCFVFWHPRMGEWNWTQIRFFIMICNVALLVSERYFYTNIHERVVSGGDVLRRIVFLTMTQTVLAYLLIKVVDLRMPVGWLLVGLGTICFILITLKRLLERTAIKWYRQKGGNTRTVTFVGSDPDIQRVNQCLLNDPTTGYRMIGHYGDEDIPELLEHLDDPEQLKIGDEMYVCLSTRERDTIHKLSRFCDLHMVQFHYVPISVEYIQLGMEREFISDIEIYTSHQSPLQIPLNRVTKRLFDIFVSLGMLLITGLILPFVYIIIKIQSPGPLFFKQLRTGLDGKSFMIYKFRSMHVNEDADKLQASKDDVRKFPFGKLMRKTNIDELPQAWNVLKGEMSIVGPRPHMIAHTEMYSKVIDKYMVRHFVKPGMTGWAQATGFRGETKELWQMEERVRRDIWYIEHWSIWLDLRIVWLTIKNMIKHDKNAY